jgi:hypothetical protein
VPDLGLDSVDVVFQVLYVLKLAQPGAVSTLSVGQHSFALPRNALRVHVILVRSRLVALHRTGSNIPEGGRGGGGGEA